MTQYILTYDLSCLVSPHSKFLEQAENHGWSRWIWGPKAGKFLHLPNTTVIGEFPDSASARKAFDDALAATTAALGQKVTSPKFAIGSFTATTFNSDVKSD